MSFSHRLRRGRGLRRLLLAIAPIESINAPGRINQLLLAGKEWMTSRANLDMQVAFASRTRLELFAARAGHFYFAILRMNSGFHFFPHFIQLSLSVSIKRFMIRAAIVLGQARGTHEKSSQVAIDNGLNRVLQVV